MLAPLRYVVSMHKRSKLTILSIGIVVMFLTSVTVTIYSFEVSNRELAERFESKYYIISSSPDFLKSRVSKNLVGKHGVYVSMLPVKIGNRSTYMAGIYDPSHLLGKKYLCGKDEIILGKELSIDGENVIISWSNGSAWMKVGNRISFDLFPDYWVIANSSFVINITGYVNFIIVKEKIEIEGYEIYSMTTFNSFYQKTVEQITWDLLFLELIAIVVIYIFTNTLLHMEIRENVRKIGIMKALGSTNKNIVGIYLLRSLFIGFSGMVLGFSLGVVISYFMSTFIPPLFGISTYFTIYIPPEVFLLDLIIAVIGALLASIGPIRRAVKIEILRGMGGALP
ncbi:MAG: FtsX-like permease family protein [Thermoplasmata archaeon]|nr:FtsX-like permease family protein [Thermoplasmata archaeon]